MHDPIHLLKITTIFFITFKVVSILLWRASNNFLFEKQICRLCQEKAWLSNSGFNDIQEKIVHHAIFSWTKPNRTEPKWIMMHRAINLNGLQKRWDYLSINFFLFPGHILQYYLQCHGLTYESYYLSHFFSHTLKCSFPLWYTYTHLNHHFSDGRLKKGNECFCCWLKRNCVQFNEVKWKRARKEASHFL